MHPRANHHVLWRAAGSPALSGNVALSGVEPDAYYYKALQWAAEKQLLASGYFYAASPCTRAAAVEYMWKYAGMPSSNTELPFTDVDADSAMAVRWALDNHVTNGTSATAFGPDIMCTRAQIVTFLYRAFAK